MERRDYELLTQRTATAVVRCLGADFRHVTMDYRHYAKIEHTPSGFTFGWSCRGFGANAKRMHVSAIAPQGAAGLTRHLPPGPSITFDPARPPKAIARELRRRFIDPWLALWPAIAADASADIVHHDRCRTLVEELAAITDGRVSSWQRDHEMRGGFDLGGDRRCYVRAHVHKADEVTLELSYVTADQARRILKLLTSETL